MAEATLSPIKRGTSLLIAVAFTIDGQPALPNQYTASSMLRTENGGLVAALTVEKLTPASEADASFRLSASSEVTAAWPVGKLKGDIKITHVDGVTHLTETFVIPVEETHTYGSA